MKELRQYEIKAIRKRFDGKIFYSPDGCWYWLGAYLRNGYGQFCIRSGGKSLHVKTHRLSYFLRHGDLPTGLFICHTCDNRKCVNPDHLFAATHEENMRDMREKGRSCRGSKNGRSILTADDVVEIRRLAASSRGQRAAIAKMYGLAVTSIGQIVNRRKWKHVA